MIAELYGLLIAHYAVRTAMHDAACQAGPDPDRLSFVGAVSLIRDALYDFQLVVPAQHPALCTRLLADLARTPLPPPAKRTNPRVVKRKMSNFQLKRAPHRGLPPFALPFAATVLILAPAPPPDAQDGPDTACPGRKGHPAEQRAPVGPETAAGRPAGRSEGRATASQTDRVFGQDRRQYRARRPPHDGHTMARAGRHPVR